MTVKYPLTVTVPIKQYLAPNACSSGLDREAELAQLTVQQFQALDPSLTPTYIRGHFVAIVKTWNQRDLTLDITIQCHDSDAAVHWGSVPVDFLYGMLEGQVNTRTVKRQVGKAVTTKRRSK